MKQTYRFTLLAASLVLPMGIAMADPETCPCKPLPSFSLSASNGKTYTKEMLSAKPTVVVFLKAGCPHNPKATVDFNRFMTSIGKNVNFVAVTNLDAAAASKYAKELKANFPLLADKNGKLVAAFGATKSLDLGVICSKDKKIVKTWSGYSQQTLKEIVAALPQHGGKALKLSFAGYPAKRQSGCSF